MSNISFRLNPFKSRLLLTRQNVSACGNKLNVQLPSITHDVCFLATNTSSVAKSPKAELVHHGMTQTRDIW